MMPNVLCLGARELDHNKVPALVKAWLSTDFQGRPSCEAPC